MQKEQKIKKDHSSGASVLEYVIVVLAVILALIAMRPYLKNAITGQYRKAGEGIGFFRQYDPKDTRACVKDEAGFWYSRRCFEDQMSKCPLDVPGLSSAGAACFNGIKTACQAPCAGI